MADEQWTIDTVVKHFAVLIAEHEARNKERFAAAKASIDTALVSAEKALSKAEIATEKRFDSVNEFRKTLSDQATQFIPRGEYAVQHKSLMDKADMNAERITQLEAHGLGRTQGTSWIGHIVIGVFMGLNTLAAISAILISILHR